MKNIKLSLCFAVLLVSVPVQAKLLRIIHTNDLHSHLEKGSKPGFGGYATVKAVIDDLKADAARAGVDTLVLDAGDFSEGSQFYLADQGEQSWRVMDGMGYDAVAIGNHDWLMGLPELNRVIRNVKPKFNLLGANFVADKKHTDLVAAMKPYAEFEKAGVRIAVVGFATDLFAWAWRAGKGVLRRPETIARDLLPKLRENNDFVIALTHLGVSGDKGLVRSTSGIDIVVGGHSHTTISEPVYTRDQRNHRVPIVQAGAHGHYVGNLVVDLVPGRPVRVVSYELVPVSADGPKDAHLEELVRGARNALEEDYGSEWLYEVLGHSEVPLERPMNESTVWGKLFEDAIRESARAHISLNQGALYGPDLPAGPVTRELLFEFYPRVFDFSDRYGWTIWTAKAPGWLLKLALKTALENGAYLNTSGFTYDVRYENGKKRITNMKIGGKCIKRFKNYRIAMPEGIIRASTVLNKYFKYILRKPTNTRIPILSAVEKKVRKMGVVRAGKSFRADFAALDVVK